MRTWFITGASRGIGRLLAEAALSVGDRVVATARRLDGLSKALRDHARLLPLQLDVTDAARVREGARLAVERFGRIDVLLNNAGFGLLGAAEEATAEEVEAIYRTNVFGRLAVTRAVLPQMRRQRPGHVLNASSLGGYQSGPGFGVYCSTKLVVEGLSEALAAELAPLGVCVTIFDPGYVRTDLLDPRSLTVSATRIDDDAMPT